MFSPGKSYFAIFMKTDILKLQFDQESEFVWVCLNTVNIFIQLELAKITQNCHDKIFLGKTDTIFH